RLLATQPPSARAGGVVAVGVLLHYSGESVLGAVELKRDTRPVNEELREPCEPALLERHPHRSELLAQARQHLVDNGADRDFLEVVDAIDSVEDPSAIHSHALDVLHREPSTAQKDVVAEAALVTSALSTSTRRRDDRLQQRLRVSRAPQQSSKALAQLRSESLH